MVDAPPAPPPAPPASGPAPARKKRGCLFWGSIIALVLLLIIGLGIWGIVRSLRPTPIQPTELTEQEEQVLEGKLEILRQGAERSDELAAEPPRDSRDLPVTVDAEEDPDFVRKPIVITEREINGMLDTNTELGDKVRVTLTRDRVLLKIVVPVPPEYPVIGGKTLRLAARARASLEDEQLEIRLEKISFSGIPVPNAWLMDLQDMNLVDTVFPDEEMQAAFTEGIESFEIRNGEMEILLAE